jgi:hypothetical protein
MTLKKSFNLDRVAEYLILVYLAECAFGSSGRWIEIGPLSIRMLLFTLCFVTSLPAVFRNLKELTRNTQVILTVLYGVALLASAVMGILFSNSINYVASDVVTYLSFALVPGFFAIMCKKEAIERGIRVIYWSSFVLALFTVIVHLLGAFLSGTQMQSVSAFLNASSLGGLSMLKTGIMRIYMRSQIFLQVSFIYGVYLIWQSSGKKKIIYYITEGIVLSGIILSFTRGFWLGLALSCFIVLFFFYRKIVSLLKILAVSLASLCVLIGISWCLMGGPYIPVEIVNRFDPNLIVVTPADGSEGSASGDFDQNEFNEAESIIDQENQGAVQVREQSLAYIYERISLKPLFGSGLGFSLEAVREGFRTEYMYHDVVLKTGFVGLLFFIAVYFGFLPIHFKNEIKLRKSDRENSEEILTRDRILLAAFIGVALTSYFNPFLSNPMGISLLMLTAVAVFETKKTNMEAQK